MRIAGPADAKSSALELDDWGHPGRVAGLWLVATFLHVLLQLRFPDVSEVSPYVSSALYVSSAPVLAALIAASVARLRDRAMALAGLLLLVDCIVTLCSLALASALERWVDAEFVRAAASLTGLVASVWLIHRTLRRERISAGRRSGAALAALLVLFAWPSISLLDEPFLDLSAGSAAEAEYLPPDIDEERLWTSQPALLADALARVAAPRPGQANTFLVTVGASGSQALFGREARFARATLGRAFGAEDRSILLANDEASLYRAPLATARNLGRVLAGLGEKADPARDLVVIYLTSHGGKQAELASDLPDGEHVQTIGAGRLAEALDRAGIRRRVIIVSACYAGSWIKPLAGDDTIVIAAARADRTSFGCSDDRQLTYFGEALLKGPLASGASLASSFDATRRTVARWEGQEQHSEPQAFVGRNMAAVWTAPRLSAL